ncbi:MAG: LLM class flavin-dependent oxidoreductase [Candidatus Binatia bacterium]
MSYKVKCAAVVPLTDFATARTVAEQAEVLGFHAIAAEDHFFMTGMGRDRNEPRLECFTLLSALAPLTRSITLTQIVTASSFRHPALLAKIITTLHQITGGRVELGLGAGWFREEYEAFGFPYAKPSVRIAQMAEAVQIIKRLWSDDGATFHGDFYHIANAPHAPKPQPRPRIMLGGGGDKLLRVAAAEADIANIIPPSGGARGKIVLGESLQFDMDAFRRRVDLLAAHCKDIGRDMSEIELSGMVYVLIGRTEEEADAMARMTAQMMGLQPDDMDAVRASPNTLVGTSEQVATEIRRRLADLGVTYYFCNFLSPDMLGLFGREVIPRLRDQ